MTGRCVVITGVTSFIGHHLAQGFAEAGWSVTGTYRSVPGTLDPARAERWRYVEPFLDRAETLDLDDGDGIRALVDRVRPDLWIHHAGHAAGFASADYDLARGVAVNVLPLDAVYAALAGSGAGVIVTGSGMEYGAAPIPHLEDGPCLPSSSYGLTKLCETLRSRQLAVSSGVVTRVARIYTVFGSRDKPDRFIPVVIDRLRRGEPVTVAPGVARDLVSVWDVVQGYLKLSETIHNGDVFRIFNLTRGTPTALTDVALSLARLVGAGQSLVNSEPAQHRVGEPATLTGSAARAEREIGWRARDLPGSLERLVDQISAHGV